MPTPMEKIPSTPSEELFEILFETAFDNLTRVFKLGPITATSLLARWAGTRVACIDRLMQENMEFRVAVCEPGKDHLTGESDCDDLFKANYQLAYNVHKEAHLKKTAHAEKSVSELLDKLRESRKEDGK